MLTSWLLPHVQCFLYSSNVVSIVARMLLYLTANKTPPAAVLLKVSTLYSPLQVI